MEAPLPILAGLLLGLASSLHCAGMCGTIASAVLFVAHPQGGLAARGQTLVLTQTGRIAAYAVAGGLLGAFGSGLAGAFDQAAAFRVLQWASAAALGWIGLSTAGLLPAMAGFDRLAAPVGGAIMTLSARAPHLAAAAPLATGIAWGFMPCAMVYGALLTAMLTGSGAGGASLMLGFGLGTLPGVVTGALSITCLRAPWRSAATRRILGLAIAGFGAVSLALSPEGSFLCIPLR